MKKIVSAIVLCAMLACAIVTSVSAAGEIVWQDDFSTKDPGNLFDVENGKVTGWAECVVLQSNYPSDKGGTRRFKECAWKVDACYLEDGGNDSEWHYLGIWFADYLSPYGSEEPDGQIVYQCGYDFEKGQFQLFADFDGAAADLEPTSGYTRGEPIAVAAVPESEAPVMDPTGAAEFSIGMRISGGVLSCFMNNKKYIEINAYRGATTATQLGSPVLLINHQCHCTFDNVVVATPDYDLFNEGAGASAPADAAPAATEQVIETEKVVIGTNEDGSEITDVVTNAVARPAANTGAAATGGTAARTGDGAIVVIAVMIVSLGTAIAVARLALRRGDK